MNLWLKSLKRSDGKPQYTVAQVNYLPIAGQGIQLVVQLVSCGLSDWTGKRLPFLLFHSVSLGPRVSPNEPN